MGDALTLEQMAVRIGEPVERLRHWRSLGLVRAGDSEEFRPEDAERARLVQLFLRRGIGLETITQAAEGGLLDRYAGLMFPGGAGPGPSLAGAAGRGGGSRALGR